MANAPDLLIILNHPPKNPGEPSRVIARCRCLPQNKPLRTGLTAWDDPLEGRLDLVGERCTMAIEA